MRKIAWAIFITIVLLFPRSCYAVSVTIDSFPSSINSDSFPINVSILGASPGTNYIRVDLYRDGTSNYFGETYNGSDWYSGSDGKQYFPITIVSSKSTASAVLQARAGSLEGVDYDGQGQYKMRVRRYTGSGGQGSEDSNLNAVNISIVIPTPTLVPTSTPTQCPTNTPVPTVKPTPTIQPTIYVPKTPTPIKTKITEMVLSDSTNSATDKITEKQANQEKQKSQGTKNNFSKVFISFGIIILIACAILIILKLRKEDI
jgi:hypothetical protein